MDRRRHGGAGPDRPGQRTRSNIIGQAPVVLLYCFATGVLLTQLGQVVRRHRPLLARVQKVRVQRELVTEPF